MAEEIQETKLRVDNGLAIGMLSLAVAFDGAQAVITFFSFIPGLIILNPFLAFVAYIWFGLWFALRGVQFFGGKKAAYGLLAVFGSLAIEITPFIDALPAIVGGVLLIIAKARIEDTIGKKKDLEKMVALRAKNMADAGALKRKEAEGSKPAESDAELAKRKEEAEKKEKGRQAVEKRKMVMAASQGRPYAEPTGKEVVGEQENPQWNAEEDVLRENMLLTQDSIESYVTAERNARLLKLGVDSRKIKELEAQKAQVRQSAAIEKRRAELERLAKISAQGGEEQTARAKTMAELRRIWEQTSGK